MRTILLADDSPTIRRLVTQTFADSNFKISEVSNGDAAVKRFDELKPDIVLTDIYMPGKNGYEVCSYVRSHPALGSTPVILLVGAFDAFDEERAKKAGAAANITKPFEPGALIDLVNSVLSSAAEARPEPQAQQPPEPQPEPERRPEIVMHALPQPVVEVAEPKTEILMPPFEEAPEPAPQVQESAEAAVPTPAPVVMGDEDDLLGLHVIFNQEYAADSSSGLSEADIDRIADRVIQKLSSQVIQSMAWDIVPDIVEKVVREELKRSS
jgi:CheY-like chemotaxis protein